MVQQLKLPGAGTSLVGVSAATLGAIYGPDGRLVSEQIKTSGDFGYGSYEPFTPQLPDGTPPRVTQYPVGWNLLTSIRQEDGKSLSFPALRSLVSFCPYARVAIEIRKKKFRGRTLDFIPRENGQSRSARKTPEYIRQAKAAKAFWSYPNRIDQLRFSGFINQMAEELFITDGLVFYPWRTNRNELYALRQINPDTIKVLIDDLGTPSGYQQFLYGRAASGYEALLTTFDRDELLYLTYNPRVDALYGTSPIEEIATIVQLAIRRLIYQLGWYSDSNTPPAYMEAPEGISTPAQLAALQGYFDDLAEDQTQRHRLRIVPKGASIRDVRPAILFTKDEEEAMLTLICTHLGVDRAKFIAQVNRATAETGAQEAEDSGQKPLEIWCKEWIDEVTQSAGYLGLDGIECQWAGEREGSVKEQAEARAVYVTAGIKTVDETRAEMGLDPLEADDVAGPGGQQVAAGVSARDSQDGDGSAVAVGGDGDGETDADDGPGGSVTSAPPGSAPVATKPRAGAAGASSAAPGGVQAQKAAREELATWRRFALKPERVKRGRWADAFAVKAIPASEAADIAFALSRAQSEDEARLVFASVPVERRKAPDHPATPIEKTFIPVAGARGAEIGKKLAQILAGAKSADEVRHAIRSHRDELVDAGLVNVLAGAILKARADGLAGT